MAWNVPAWTSLPGSPTSRMIRSRSSPAARFVNVTARIRHGATRLTPTRYAILWARTLRLARARSRENQHGTLGGRDRASLLGVEPSQDLALPRVSDLGLVLLLRGLRGRVFPGLRNGHVRRLGQPRRLRGQGRRRLARRRWRDLLEARALALEGSIVDPGAAAPARGGSHAGILVGAAWRSIHHACRARTLNPEVGSIADVTTWERKRPLA